MSKRIKIAFIIIVPILLVLIVTLPFFSKNYPQKKYHDEIRSIEEYLYQNEDRYLCSDVVNISEQTGIFDWYILVDKNDCPDIIFRLHSLLLTYFSNNNDCILNQEYYIAIIISDASKVYASSGPEDFACMQNYVEGKASEKIKLDGLLYVDLYDGDYSRYLEFDGIQAIYIDPHYIDKEGAVSLVNSLEDLRYVCVHTSDSDYTSYIQEKCPGVICISR